MDRLAVTVAVIVLVALAAATGCSSDPSEMSCGDIAASLRTRVSTLSSACETASDCVVVGYPQRDDGFPTCNCGVAFMPQCPGATVNAAAWESDERVQALVDEWERRCVPGGLAEGAPGGACDCGPGTAACVDGQCGATDFYCTFADDR